MNKAFIDGFVKQAVAKGVSHNQAVLLLKEALSTAAMSGIGGAVAGGLGGAAGAYAQSSKKNRLRNMLLAGLSGAALGGGVGYAGGKYFGSPAVPAETNTNADVSTTTAKTESPKITQEAPSIEYNDIPAGEPQTTRRQPEFYVDATTGPASEATAFGVSQMAPNAGKVNLNTPYGPVSGNYGNLNPAKLTEQELALLHQEAEKAHWLARAQAAGLTEADVPNVFGKPAQPATVTGE